VDLDISFTSLMREALYYEDYSVNEGYRIAEFYQKYDSLWDVGANDHYAVFKFINEETDDSFWGPNKVKHDSSQYTNRLNLNVQDESDYDFEQVYAVVAFSGKFFRYTPFIYQTFAYSRDTIKALEFEDASEDVLTFDVDRDVYETSYKLKLPTPKVVPQYCYSPWMAQEVSVSASIEYEGEMVPVSDFGVLSLTQGSDETEMVMNLTGKDKYFEFN
jgi:hypothetical protein